MISKERLAELKGYALRGTDGPLGKGVTCVELAELLEAYQTNVIDLGELKGGDAFLGGMMGAFAGGMLERKLREFGQRPKCEATRGGRRCSLPLGHDTPHLWGAKKPADAKAKKGSSRS